MKSNRFDFLELSDQAVPPDSLDTQQVGQVNVAIPSTPPSDATSSRPQPVPLRQVAPPRLAEVRVDPDSTRFGVTQSAAPQPLVGPAPRRLKPVEVFGSRGSTAGEFNFPAGMAIDNTGILWIADSYNHRLQRITPDGGVSVVGTRGLGRGQFMMPMDVAVDEARAFYVVDQAAHRVQKFSADGVLELVIGRSGSRPGEMRSPMGIAVNRDTNEIIVADTGNSRVQRFDGLGRFMGVLGEGELQGAKAISNPQAVVIDIYGRIYVADTLARRILQFDQFGRLLGYYGGAIGPGQRPGSITLNLNEPRAISVNDAGRLFITDAHRGAGRISVINVENGNLEAEISNAGKKLGPLTRPGGVAVTPAAYGGSSTGDVYVADTMNHRVIRFTWVG